MCRMKGKFELIGNFMNYEFKKIVVAIQNSRELVAEMTKIITDIQYPYQMSTSRHFHTM